MEMTKTRMLVGIALLIFWAWGSEARADGVQTPSWRVPEPQAPFEMEAKAVVFSGGGGPLLLAAELDLSGLERALSGLVDVRGDLNLGGQSLFLMKGGGGFTGGHLRLGGMSAGGEWTYAVRGESPFDRAKIELSIGGLLVERLLAQTGGLGVAFGAILGGGSWALEFSEQVNGGFREIIAEPPHYLKLERSFWQALPYLAVEWKWLDFLGARVSAGYGLSLSFGDWELPGGQSAPGGPLESMGFPFVRLMFVFGG